MRACAAAQVVIEVLGELLTLEVIAVLEFNSDRKRMSIIVRMPNGRWALSQESWTAPRVAPAAEVSSIAPHAIQQGATGSSAPLLQPDGHHRCTSQLGTLPAARLPLSIMMRSRTCCSCTTCQRGAPECAKLPAGLKGACDTSGCGSPTLQQAALKGVVLPYRVRIFCKGADSMMYARVAPGQAVADATSSHLAEMSRNGFRTLCMGQRDVEPAEFQATSAHIQPHASCA